MSLPIGLKIERHYVAVDMLGEAVRRLSEIYDGALVRIEDSSGYEFGDYGIRVLVETKFDVAESMARMDKFHEWYLGDISRNMSSIVFDHCYIQEEPRKRKRSRARHRKTKRG